jgi:3-hydroxymyristoyl/3-hydroxydecanoyl-(acyl carrier protein) dehydratase
MNYELPIELKPLFKQATKQLIMPDVMATSAIKFDKSQVKAVLPQRDPILLVDRVKKINMHERSAIAEYDLSNASDVLAGHFPYYAMWPGVLQIEAIGQTGAFAGLLTDKNRTLNAYITYVCGAQFMHPITNVNGVVEMRSRFFEDGMFFIVIGQCIYENRICSVAALKGLLHEPGKML